MVNREEGVKAPVLSFQTFGNFECFIDGQPIRFKYNKTKEMLAYLVDRKGAMCTNGELMSILWAEDSDKKKSYLKNLKADLTRVLAQAGLEDVLIKFRGSIGIATDKVSCDYYDLIDNKEAMLGNYWGEYMNQYSWSELTHAYLEDYYNLESKKSTDNK